MAGAGKIGTVAVNAFINLCGSGEILIIYSNVNPSTHLHRRPEPAEEGGFVMTVPALPELGTQGDTYNEAMANARGAIEQVIEDRLTRGEPIPSDV